MIRWGSGRAWISYGTLTLGERRLPALNQADGATAPTGTFSDALILSAPNRSSVPTGTTLQPGAWTPSVIIHPPAGATFTPTSSAPTFRTPAPASALETLHLERPTAPGVSLTLPATRSLQPLAPGLDWFLHKIQPDPDTATRKDARDEDPQEVTFPTSTIEETEETPAPEVKTSLREILGIQLTGLHRLSPRRR
jgi:hypothetical protein